MPYALGDPLSAGLAAASGVMAGQQAKKQRDAEMKRQAMLDAQAQADTQARFGMAKSQQEATQQSRQATEQQRAQQIAIAQANADREQKKADAEAQKQKLLDTFKGEERDFFSHEMTLSPDPVKRLGQLQKRYDIERGKGYDTKSTEAQMNKAATEVEQQRRQADLEKQRGVQNANAAQRIQISIDRPRAEHVPRNSQGLTPEEVIQNAHWDAEHPKGGKPAKPTSSDARGKDQQDAVAALSRVPPTDTTGAKNKIINHFAAKWNLTLDQARSYLQ